MEFGEIKIVDGRILIHPTKDGTAWLTKHQIAHFFECFVSKVNANICVILKTGVLEEIKVCRTYYYKNGNSVEQYNLEMIIALSFQIKSKNAQSLRHWIVEKTVTNTAVNIIRMIAGRSVCLN